MWSIMIENCNHFYWLTGEIPPTFDLLMDELQADLPQQISGRKCVLNMQNQVKTFILTYDSLIVYHVMNP